MGNAKPIRVLQKLQWFLRLRVRSFPNVLVVMLNI